MKKKFLHLSLLFVVVFLFSSCESVLNSVDDDADAEVEKLHVKFINTESSEYTIKTIQILIMGVAGDLAEPNGEFSNNILPEGSTIAPGEFTFFDLEIPNSYYSYCRLGVIDELGNSILLNEQEGYSNLYEGTITHWGSHDRTVDATIVTNKNTGNIMVSGWGEWAGIE